MAQILVSAAASLRDVFEEIGAAFTRPEGRIKVRFNFAASGALAQQILRGAPVDAFAAAGAEEMDTLARANRIEPGTRRSFADNRLVLIAPVRGGTGVQRWADLAAPAVRRIAVGNPATVPAGRYARQTLEARGLWTPAVRQKAVLGENVRQTLAYVAGGDVDAGIVFATDVRGQARRVRVVAEAVPGRDHRSILYTAAVVRGAPNAAAARRFLSFLNGAVAQSILARHGFLPMRPPRPR